MRDIKGASSLMAWKISTEFDDDNDGVGMVICSYFDNATDAEPSFVYSARADTKIQTEFRGVMREAVRLRRRNIAKIAKQNAIIAAAETFINNFEVGVTTSGN